MKRVLIIISVFVAIFGIFLMQNDLVLEKKYRIGVLTNAKFTEISLRGFKDSLKDLGFRENETIEFVYEGVLKLGEQLSGGSQSLLQEKPDLIIVLTTPAALEIKNNQQNQNIPVLFAPVSNPIGAGLVNSMNSPGKNFTGVTFGLQEEKRLEWLLKVLPETKNIFYPYNKNDKSPKLSLEKLQELAKIKGVKIVTKELDPSYDFSKLEDEIPNEIDAIFMPTDALIASKLKILVGIQNSKNIPLSVPHRLGVEGGAFMSYGFSMYELGYQAGKMAKEIFDGVEPKELPVQFSEFKLSFNVQSAEIIQKPIPEDILINSVVIR